MTMTTELSFQTAVIEGYAAIFNEPDLNGDRIEPGAFGNRFSKIPMLYQHQVATPIGVWTQFTADSKGLFARGILCLDHSVAKDSYALICQGALTGLSIGFRVVAATKPNRGGSISRQQGGRIITKAELWEVSLVSFPMAVRARITNIGKSQRTLPTDPARAGSMQLGKRTNTNTVCAHTPQDVHQFTRTLDEATTILTST